MISRQTIFALLLALLVAGGLRLWVLEHRDDCDRLDPQTRRTPTMVVVQTGSRQALMPCNVWLPRQPLGLQIGCVADAALFVVFLVSVWSDRVRRRRARRL